MSKNKLYTLLFSCEELEYIKAAIEHAAIWSNKELLKANNLSDKLTSYIDDEVHSQDINNALLRAGIRN